MKKALLTAIICTFAALQSCSSGKRSFATAMKGTETTNSTAEYTAVIREIADKGEFWNTLFTLVNIGSEKENVCISPLSAQLALSMTAAGATGETQKQMYDAMLLTGDVNKSSKELIGNITAPNEQCEVKIANSIWINEGFKVKSPFVDVNKQMYDAEVRNLDFSSSKALSTINNWASDKTHGLIPQVLQSVSPSAAMYLLNALYFKGIWQEDYKFDKKNTQPEDFTNADGSVTKVQMMNQTNNYAFLSFR